MRANRTHEIGDPLGVKEDEVIDAGEAGQDFGTIEFVIDGARGTFQRTNAGVAIDRHQQRIAKGPRCLKVTNMADVQQVEATIGKDQTPPIGVQLGAHGCDFGDGLQFSNTHDSHDSFAALGVWASPKFVWHSHRSRYFSATMNDPRFAKLAKLLTYFSVSLKKGEKVLIDAFEIPDEMTVELIRAVRALGAAPLVQVHHARVTREMALGAQEEALDVHSAVQLAQMKKVHAYIAFRGGHNITEMSDVPSDRMKLVSKKMKAVLDWRVKKTKWCVLRWPTPSMAQSAGMSTEAFEDFYFNVCTLDYSKMVPGMKALAEAMMATDKVEIKGPGTDLRFSIKGIPAIPCGGTHNIPDGEVFTAPVKNSIQGVVQYNAPTIYQGVAFDNVRLEFKDGKIVNATANNTKALNDILDSDPGARFIGEFAIGFNPYVLHPMRDILFDEKINGSFHFTPGQCYEQTENGNRSQVHWDLVNIQREDYGGGTIYFDGKLIRENGRFVPKALQALNPERLK